VFRREVVLHSGARHWVYAQTLMRPTGLSGANRELRHLQNRPLGELLFAGKSRRLDLRMTRLSPHCALRRRAQLHQLLLPVGSHARCSWFDYHGSALLVHECLLPELLCHDSAQ
jgi:chorismate-pyruvate lyase